jgi:transcriptional regulator with XRE-family HTH domain
MLTNDLNRLGKRIRELRTNRGLSQEGLSELSGISSRHISEMERGVSNPSYQVLKQIAGSLAVPMQNLFDHEHLRDDKDIQNELVAIIKKLPAEKLKIAYRVITVLAE